MVRSLTPQQAARNALAAELKLSGASSGESPIPKEGILNMVRSLTPQQAARNALAAEFTSDQEKSLFLRKPARRPYSDRILLAMIIR
jgi:hypothetical protein